MMWTIADMRKTTTIKIITITTKITKKMQLLTMAKTLLVIIYILNIQIYSPVKQSISQIVSTTWNNIGLTMINWVNR